VDNARAHITKVSGVDIHWVDARPRESRDDAPAVVLIHGLLDWHRAWNPVTARLVAAGFRVLAVDLPGHGLSGRSDVPYTLEWNARVIGSWFDVAEVRNASVVGHSYGGGVAQMLCLTHAHRMDRLGLVAPGGFGREVNVAIRFAAVPFFVQELGQPWLSRVAQLVAPIGGRKTWDAEERAWANARPGTARALHRTVRDVIGLTGQVRHFLDRAHEAPFVPPTCVWWGDRDRVLPFSQAKKLPKILEGARIVRFAGAGHYPHHDFPDAFTTDLVAFLRDERAENATILGKKRGNVSGIFSKKNKTNTKAAAKDASDESIARRA
jgi:pimeloyl-ACP methyl ester carboxylesterase